MHWLRHILVEMNFCASRDAVNLTTEPQCICRYTWGNSYVVKVRTVTYSCSSVTS